MPKYRINNRQFLFWWTAGSLAVWPTTIVLGVPLFFVVPFLALFSDSFLDSTISFFGTYLVIALLIGSVIGFSVGLIQRALIRRLLYWELDHWLFWSVIGGAIGAVVFGIMQGFSFLSTGYFDCWLEYCESSYATPTPVMSFLPMTIVVACLSAIQCLSLRYYVRSAWLWILANIIGGITFSTMLTASYDDPLFLWMIAAAVQGLVTGTIILWLFRNQVIATETEI